MGTMFWNEAQLMGTGSPFYSHSFDFEKKKQFILSQLWAWGCQVSPLFLRVCLFIYLLFIFFFDISHSYFKGLVTTEYDLSSMMNISLWLSYTEGQGFKDIANAQKSTMSLSLPFILCVLLTLVNALCTLSFGFVYDSLLLWKTQLFHELHI